MKKHVLLTIMFLFVAAIGFILVEERPPSDDINIELSFDQPTAEVMIIDCQMENPVKFVEVEISPGDLFANIELVKGPFVVNNANRLDRKNEALKNNYIFLGKKKRIGRVITYSNMALNNTNDSNGFIRTDFDYSENKLLKQSCQI
jgi:hypothetical protein